MKPSIEETLVDWLGAQSLEVSKIEVEERWNVLYKADGEFRPVGVDKYEDGRKIELDYMYELERRDARFEHTKLTFISDTKFQIR